MKNFKFTILFGMILFMNTVSNAYSQAEPANNIPVIIPQVAMPAGAPKVVVAPAKKCLKDEDCPQKQKCDLASGTEGKCIPEIPLPPGLALPGLGGDAPIMN